MRVLITNHFPLEGSGSGVYTQNIAYFLTKNNIDVTVIAPDVKPVAKDKYPFDVRTVLFKKDDSQKEYDLDFNFPCFTTHPESINTFYTLNDNQIEQYMNKFEEKIKETINEKKIDLFHGQHIWALSYLGFKCGLKGITTCHGTDLMGIEKDLRYRKYADKTVENSNYIIGVSKDTSRKIIETFPEIKKEKVITILNGFNPEIFRPLNITKKQVFDKLGLPETKYLISFVGKLAHFKGVDVLIKAASIYEKELGDVTTLITGNGQLLETLKQQKNELGLKNLHFIGQHPQTEIAEINNAADLSIVPSRKEPFGLVAIEALACKTPAVVSDDGGLAEFINDKVGGVFKSEDHNDLAVKIIDEIKNNTKLVKGAAAAEYAINNFSWNSVVKKVIDLYERCLI